MPSGWRSPFFFLILAVYLLAGVLFATLTPPWQAPDEPAHYNYIRYLTRQGSFPELVSRCYNQAYLEQLKSQRFPPELPLDSVCYEFHQPPLYYLLTAPIFSLSGGSLLALRLASVLLGAGVVALAWGIARTIFPHWPSIFYGTAAFVAFTPMHVAMLASVNNDALAELILAALLFLLTRRVMLPDSATIRGDITLGILLGLGLITKTTVYIAVPLVGVALWLAAKSTQGGKGAHPFGCAEGRREQGSRGVDWSVLVRQGLMVFGVALVMALPWYGRNAALYGNLDILGLGRHDAVVVGQLRTADLLAQVGWPAYLQNFLTTTFHSFWGQFGWMAVPMSERVYLALTLLTVTAFVGCLLGIGRLEIRDSVPIGYWRLGENSNSPQQNVSRITHHASRSALALLSFTIVLMLLGYLWYNLEFAQFQGRYLFPALIPLGLFFSLGLYTAFLPRRTWLLVGGLALALAWIIVTGLMQGDVDLWAVVIVGLPLALAGARVGLASRWPVPAAWLLLAVYTGLALLTLISPFWYVIPYLSR
ncbi:MAG: DUF2142 domain-containing protein [Anaerolineales bacterium]|nr:DUF2142 domain-containing protein [Anaerolineales bacterium]